MERYESYKDSGVQWLGEIPSHWGCSKVMYFFDVQLGKMLQPQPKYLSDKQIDYLCAIHVGKNTLKLSPERKMWASDDDLVQYGIKKGDLLVVEGGDVGSCAIVKENINGYIIQNALHRVRSKNICKVDYLQYLLNTAKYKGHFEKICSRATIAHFTKEKFQSFNISLPPLPEQHSIVSYLDSKCAKIDTWLEKKAKEMELLAEMKQRVIADAVTRGLNPNVKMKATDITWIPEVPEHWDVVKLKAFCKENKVKNRDNVESCVLSLSYGNIIIKQNISFGLVPDNYENYQIVSPGNIILRLTDLQNDHKSLRTGLVKNRGIITSAYVGLIVNNINSEYVHQLLHSYDIKKVFYGMGGGLRQSMSYSDISNLYIPVPPLSEQQAIVTYITERTAKIDKMIANIQKEVEHLKEYKQRLISDVVTGQIKVC